MGTRILKSKLKLIIYSYNESILVTFINSLLKEKLKANLCGPIFLPRKRRVFCVLRSPFVNKDSRDHFELNLYSVEFYSKFSTDDRLLKFLRLFLKKLSFKITNNVYIEIKKL